MTLLSLRTGRLAVDLAPSAGSAFPLVPFSNRIANGKVGEALLAPGATLAGEISFHLSDL